jgi:hypothetical protein
LPLPVANALPPLPLAPLNCTDYIYPSSAFEFKQDNNILTAFNNNGNRFDGSGASYVQSNGAGGDTRGSSTGVRNGRDITIDATWNNGFTSHVTGHIDDDLIARGTITNNQGATNTWTGLDKFKCVAPVPKPADPKPADPKPIDDKPAALTATVIQESTVYKAPDGEAFTDENGTDVFLDPGQVTLVEACSEKWCHVLTNKVPPGNGWIYRIDFVTVP